MMLVIENDPSVFEYDSSGARPKTGPKTQSPP